MVGLGKMMLLICRKRWKRKREGEEEEIADEQTNKRIAQRGLVLEDARGTWHDACWLTHLVDGYELTLGFM